MTLTQITEKGIKDGEIINADINASAAISKSKLENFVTNNADNRVITGSGTTNTLNGEADFTYDGDNCIISRGGNSVAGLTVKNVNNSQANAVSQISIEGGDNSYAALQLETNGQAHKLYQLNTGHLGIEKAGVERIRLDSTGIIGLNVTSPLSTLHVKTPSTHNGTLRLGGSSADLGFLFEYDQASATTSKIYANPTYTNTGAVLKIGVDGDANPDQLVLKGNGTVGIGTSTPLTDAELTISAADTPSLAFQRSGSGKFETAIAIESGHFHFKAGADSSTVAGLSNVFKIESTGNVGIGTTSPGTLLHQHEDSSGANYHKFTNSTTGSAGTDGAYVGLDGNEQFIMWNQETTKLRFAVGDNEKVYINNDGHLGINDGNLVIGTSGHGIDFSATSNSAGSMSSEILDDYEEGTFSPILRANGDTTGQVTGVGRYTKVGNMVHCVIDFEGTNASGIPNATVTQCTGLPYNVLNSNSTATATTLMSYNVYNAGRTNPTFYASGNTDSLYSIYSVSGGAWQHWPTNDINQSSIYLNFSITYFTAT